MLEGSGVESTSSKSGVIPNINENSFHGLQYCVTSVHKCLNFKPCTSTVAFNVTLTVTVLHYSDIAFVWSSWLSRAFFLLLG